MTNQTNSELRTYDIRVPVVFTFTVEARTQEEAEGEARRQVRAWVADRITLPPSLPRLKRQVGRTPK